jgi:enterochelin esterase-like enzyme
MKTVLQILVLIISSLLYAQQYIVTKGTLKVYSDFRSEFVDNRTVAVWLPNGYNINQKYAVVYLNDGQMLFDASRTWNKHAWEVDKVFDKLLTGKKIKDCIVVGIWNNSDYRH